MSMTRKDREKLKELAKLLFVHETLSQKEVSARIGVSEQTISKWSNQDNWDQFRVSITITKEEQLRNLYRQLAEINKTIAERDGQKFASPGEADSIAKLATAIEKMETDVGISDIVSVSKKFLNWLRKTDLVRAQDLTPLFDGFIKDNMR
jgi:transposase